MKTFKIRSLLVVFTLFSILPLSGSEWKTADGKICKSAQGVLTADSGLTLFSQKLYPVDTKKLYRISGKFRCIKGGNGSVRFGVLCLDKRKMTRDSFTVFEEPRYFTLKYPAVIGDDRIYIDSEVPYLPNRIVTFDLNCLDRSCEYGVLTAPGDGRIWQVYLARRLEKDYPAKTRVRVLVRQDSHLPATLILNATEKWQEFTKILKDVSSEEKHLSKDTKFIRLAVETNPDDARTAQFQFKDLKFELIQE